MVAAGLVARKARERGMHPQALGQDVVWRPVRKVVTEYLEKAGLTR